MFATDCACGTAVTGNTMGRRGFLGAMGALAAGSMLGCQATADTVAGKPHRIDIHHHVMPPSYVAELRKRGLGGAPAWSPQRSLEDMDKNSIATSVVALMQPGAYFNDRDFDRRMAREANEYAAQMARDFPGRFGSFATLPLADVDGSLREIEHAFGALKADGIGLMTSYGDRYLGDPHFAPIWDELNRRGATIYTHPLLPACCRNPIAGLPPSAIEYGTDTTRTAASLLFTGTASRYPNIKWILSHSGGSMPFLWSRFTRQETDMKDAAKKVLPDGVRAQAQRFYYDTAQGHHEGAIAALRALIPVSQILYGSDFPYRPGAEVTDGLNARGFSRDERRAIERGNALRILPNLRTA